MKSFLVAEFAEAERDAQLAAMDVRLRFSFLILTQLKWTTSQPRNTVSPSVVSPVVADLEENPFEAEFNAEYADADAEEAEDDELDFISPPETGDRKSVV